MQRSLTIKQMVNVSALAIVVVCLFITAQLFHFVQQRKTEYTQQMENIARTVRQPLADAVLKGDAPAVKQLLMTLKPAGILGQADIRLPEQLTVLHVDFTDNKPAEVPALIARIFRLPVQITIPLYPTGQASLPRPLASLVLVADSVRVYQFILSTLSTMMMTYLLLAFVLSVSVSWFINRLIIHPLRDICRDLQDAPGVLLKMPVNHRDDEIGILVRTVNRHQSLYAPQPVNSRILPDGAALPLSSCHDILRHCDEKDYELWLQPLINMRSGALVGAEALLRVRGADGLYSLPENFITTAEDTGRMPELGRRVFEEACRIVAHWQSQGVMLPLSVNTSARQLQDPQMVSHLQHLLSELKIDPAGLILELTETAQLDDTESAVALLKSVEQTGISVVLDDFGMGYSNLHYLHQFRSLPLKRLKLDRSFVAGLPGDDVMVRIVAAVANILQLDVVAEGVETIPQRDALLARGIDIAQGYLYSPALSEPLFNRQWLNLS